MKFGEQLVGRTVTLVFGNGIPALTGTVMSLHVDYILFEHSTDDDKVTAHHVPLSSIVYARFGS